LKVRNCTAHGVKGCMEVDPAAHLVEGSVTPTQVSRVRQTAERAERYREIECLKRSARAQEAVHLETERKLLSALQDLDHASSAHLEEEFLLKVEHSPPPCMGRYVMSLPALGRSCAHCSDNIASATTGCLLRCTVALCQQAEFCCFMKRYPLVATPDSHSRGKVTYMVGCPCKTEILVPITSPFKARTCYMGGHSGECTVLL